MERRNEEEFDLSESIGDVGDSDKKEESEEPSEPESEENTDSESSEAQEDTDQEEEPEEKPKKKRESGKTRINQLQREKYQAIDEIHRISHENEQLRKMVDFSTQAAIKNYDDTVYHKLERARQRKEQAIESGDVKEQIDADVDLATATSEINYLNNWKAQQNYQNQYQEQQQQAQNNYQQPPHVSQSHEVQRWADMNPWFNPQSNDYDEELAEQAQLYADVLDARLYRSGRQNEIMSREYFETIDNYVNSIAPTQKFNQRNLNMKSSRNSVAPVRSGGFASSSQTTQFKLTPEERNMAKMLGISEKEYFKGKMEQQPR